MQRTQGLVSLDSRSQENSMLWSSAWIDPAKAGSEDPSGRPSHLLNQVRMFVLRDVQAPSAQRAPFFTSFWADWCWFLSFSPKPSSPRAGPLILLGIPVMLISYVIWSGVVTHPSLYWAFGFFLGQNSTQWVSVTWMIIRNHITPSSDFIHPAFSTPHIAKM